MRLTLAILVSAISISVAATTLYKVVNKDGSVTYTDRPLPGAEALNLSNVNSATMPALAKPVQTSRQTNQPDTTQYQLRLTQPAEEATIRNNLGEVNVTASMEPKASGTFQLYMDGKLIETSANPRFKLTDVYRGEHQIQIKFADNSGKILASSSQRRFFMHRASALIITN